MIEKYKVTDSLGNEYIVDFDPAETYNLHYRGLYQDENGVSGEQLFWTHFIGGSDYFQPEILKSNKILTKWQIVSVEKIKELI